MKVASEKGDANTRPRLEHLETMLQELTRCEERKRQQSVEIASVNTKQKLLSDQLLQTQEELAAAQASKAKLCEEIGTLKQSKDHQARQLDKYKLNLQAARESQAAMAKKMGELEASTWTIKQQYIRSLASRIKTSALVLQQMKVTNATSLSTQIAETCNEWEKPKPNKRKRIMDEQGTQRAVEDSSKPKHAGVTVESESRSRKDLHSGAVAVVVDPVVAPKATNAVALTEQRESRDTKTSKQQGDGGAENERLITELQAQVSKLESENLALNDEYKALEFEHDEVLADSKTFAQGIKAKESKIEELMQMLEVSRLSKQDAPAIENSTSDEDKEALEGRLKMLEENLAQMNGYADQLEMVIAQCPSCTIKLHNENTQDSTTNKAE